jgi:hypothetical protein
MPLSARIWPGLNEIMGSSDSWSLANRIKPPAPVGPTTVALTDRALADDAIELVDGKTRASRTLVVPLPRDGG